MVAPCGAGHTRAGWRTAATRRRRRHTSRRACTCCATLPSASLSRKPVPLPPRSRSRRAARGPMMFVGKPAPRGPQPQDPAPGGLQRARASCPCTRLRICGGHSGAPATASPTALAATPVVTWHQRRMATRVAPGRGRRRCHGTASFGTCASAAPRGRRTVSRTAARPRSPAVWARSRRCGACHSWYARRSRHPAVRPCSGRPRPVTRAAAGTPPPALPALPVTVREASLDIKRTALTAAHPPARWPAVARARTPPPLARSRPMILTCPTATAAPQRIACLPTWRPAASCRARAPSGAWLGQVVHASMAARARPCSWVGRRAQGTTAWVAVILAGGRASWSGASTIA